MFLQQVFLRLLNSLRNFLKYEDLGTGVVELKCFVAHCPFPPTVYLCIYGAVHRDRLRFYHRFKAICLPVQKPRKFRENSVKLSRALNDKLFHLGTSELTEQCGLNFHRLYL